MKKVILLYFIGLLFTGCNKDKDPRIIKDVTDVQWQFFALQQLGDPGINPLPNPSYFKLNSDRTFEITMRNSVCKGVYSWSQSDSINANLYFTIQSWNSPDADTLYTNRLKKVLLGIDKCHYLKPPNLLPIPFSATMQLQFSGNIGYFYVFKP